MTGGYPSPPPQQPLTTGLTGGGVRETRWKGAETKDHNSSASVSIRPREGYRILKFTSLHLQPVWLQGTTACDVCLKTFISNGKRSGFRLQRSTNLVHTLLVSCTEKVNELSSSLSCSFVRKNFPCKTLIFTHKKVVR